MPGMIERIARIAAVRRGRDLALAGAFVATAGLVGQGALLALWSGARADTKIAARLDGGVVEARELTLAPREFVAHESLRTFTPTRGWDDDRPPAVAVDAEELAAQFAAIPSFELAVAPLPPPRPTRFAVQASAALRRAAHRHEPRTTIAGLELPTSADIMRGLGDMGSSIGRIFHVASR